VSKRLDEDLMRLLDVERERRGPSSAVSERLLARLDASIGDLPGGGHDGGPGDGGSGPGAAPAGWMRPFAVATTSLALGVAGGVALDRAVLPHPPPRIVYVDRVVTAPAPSAIEPAASAPPSPSASGTAIRTSATSAPSSERDRDRELAAERALLEVSRTALGRSDPAAALASLERHTRRFPSGQLREEREALAVQALAALERGPEARARAEQFKKAYPVSMFMPVIDAAVAPMR
jgi:hypothetical protein